MCILSGQPQKRWKGKEVPAFGVSYEFLCLAYEAFLSPTSVSLCRFSHEAHHKKTFLNSHVRKTPHCPWAGLVLSIPCLCPCCLCTALLSHGQTSPSFFCFFMFQLPVAPLGGALPPWGNPQASWSSSVVLVSLDSDSLVQTSDFLH